MKGGVLMRFIQIVHMYKNIQ